MTTVCGNLVDINKDLEKIQELRVKEKQIKEGAIDTIVLIVVVIGIVIFFMV